MDWQDNEFEAFLKRFRLREARPLVLAETPVVTRNPRPWIAAAAVLVLVVGATAAILQQREVKQALVPVVAQNIPAPIDKSPEIPTVVRIPAVLSEIPPVPKLDPKPPDPLKQLTVVVPPPPQDTNVAAKQDTRSQAAAPQDSGKNVFEKNCGTCHSLDLVGNSHYTAPEEYASLVDRMKAYGASLSDNEVGMVADYLFKTYGPRLK